MEELQTDKKNLVLQLRDRGREVADLETHVNSMDSTFQRNEELCRQITELDNAIKLKNKDISDLTASVDYQEMIINDLETPTVRLYDQDPHSFTADTERAVLSLIDNSVAFERIPGVIRSMAELFRCDIADRVPKESTVREMNHRRIAFGHLQLVEVMPSKESTTLLSDETTDRVGTFEGFHLADDDGNKYVLGLREMAYKASKTILDTFKRL